MQLTNDAIGKINNGNGTLADYTGNHIAVFECALKTPPSLSLIDSTFKEYVVAHRINFSNWKLVDLDNYMQGNSFFANVTTAELWQKDFDNVIGPKD
jgi:hypothetical protein